MSLIAPSTGDFLSAFLFFLVFFGILSCWTALLFGGRYVEITGEGNWLTLNKPYAFVYQQERIDLTTVQKVYMSGVGFQDRYLSFYAKGQDERADLLVRIVPLAPADLSTFADFLHRQGVAADF